MEQAQYVYSDNKEEMYALLKKQMKSVLEGERHVIPNLANASALLAGALQNVSWTGFYLRNKDELLLGPFQGKTACMHIAVGKGVCGTAAAQDATQLVKNVHQFPGHIACDSAANSEIVIPLHEKNEVVGVLDIDSTALDRFDETDARELEQIVRIIESSCSWEELKFM